MEGDTEKLPFIIFSDDKRYWNVFEPVCRELNRRGMDVVYMTASADDPAINNPYEHIKGQFIGDGNKAFAKLNFLKATMVLSTTPGLDVYQWKRSKDVGYYVHMLHAASEVVTYRMFGIDYYDAVLLSGEYQVQDMRALEKLRGLPEKEFVKIGIPTWMRWPAACAMPGRRRRTSGRCCSRPRGERAPFCRSTAERSSTSCSRRAITSSSARIRSPSNPRRS